MSNIKLVICEKPSVAQTIANLLGSKKRCDGYFEGDKYLVSWCFGHMVELVDAKDYDLRFEKWRIEDLPILPQEWKYRVIKDKASQFNVLKNLMTDKRVASFVCATDAGREGELIFRLVYDQVFSDSTSAKPFERLWISSMEDSSIIDGFNSLQDGHNYDNLYHSANCRSRADWAVGINATRLFTCMYRAPLSVGRVQTPTLAVLVEREKRIEEFTSTKSYSVLLTFDGFTAEGENYPLERSEEILRNCKGAFSAVLTSVESKERSESSPKLYDLTTLQRDANRLFGFTAQQTLDVAQQLYEKKLITYPRTDSQFITEDMQSGANLLVSDVMKSFDWAKNIKIIADLSKSVNNAKVTDHHAILPTKLILTIRNRSLSDDEYTLLEIISKRLVLSASPKYIYSSTIFEILCANEAFVARGKITLQDGWKGVQRNIAAGNIAAGDPDEEDKSLPDLPANSVLAVKTVEQVEHETTPPRYYTEDTLLSSMETAGNDELDKTLDIEKKGIGTPATRAGIIEKLISSGLIFRNKKQLRPAEKGIVLISIVPEIMKSPSLTAQWENKLSEISAGDIDSESFMKEIYALVDSIMSDQNSHVDRSIFASPENKREESRQVIGECPRCNSNVYETKSNFRCSDDKCDFALWKDAHFFTNKKQSLKKRAAASLLKNGKAKMRGFVSERTGNKYDATVVMEDTGTKYVRYWLEFED